MLKKLCITALSRMKKPGVSELHLSAYHPQEDRMKKAVQVMADSVNTLRTGRANPAILDRIMVS